jgi:hypothetical protein
MMGAMTHILDVLTTADGLAALLKVVMIDLVLAGDNAIVIGLAASGLPAEKRGRAILIGIHRRDGFTDRLCRFHHRASGNHRTATRRWNSSPLGMLEDVARVGALSACGIGR